MLTMYNLVTESNYKDVINKMTEKGYPMINEELSTKFPKGNGDVFLRSGFNNCNQRFESVFTTRAIEKQNKGNKTVDVLLGSDWRNGLEEVEDEWE